MIRRMMSGVSLLLALSAFDLQAATNNALLIRNGYVMTMAPGGQDLPQGDVLIRDNNIVAVGKNLEANGAQIIDAQDKFVLPGFVDAHSHLWVTTMRGQFRNGDGKFFPVSNRLAKVMQPDDIYIAMYSGALELLSAGITSSGDFFDNIQGPAWGDAGYKALNDSGIRAIVYYGGPDKTTQKSIDIDHLAVLARQPHGRVTPGLGWRLPRDLKNEENWAMRDREYRMAQQNALPVQVHVSGDASAMFDALIARHYLAPFVTVVHATDASEAQLAALQKAGAALAVTPLSEQHVGYGLTRLDHFHPITRQGLGIDGNSLAGSGDMFANMRLAALPP
ncbi:amidohydrolase family protein [Pantoea sp.]|uniref:amidohydrolase family protein n=1 Tax=Pantoea sp. TaxID=69393 RepID=UPI0028A069C7|nr:amidohydrolase family protein [Pantoea sp.]